MESVQQLRARKQEYLRDQIINKDYDAQQFADYCVDTKGNVDIDEWSFKDLVELVTMFVGSKKAFTATVQDKFESFGSSGGFENVFERSPNKNQAVEHFSSFGGVQSQSATSAKQQFNFEFIPESKPTNLNSLDLDFLSSAFMGTTTQSQKSTSSPVTKMQNTFSTPSKVQNQLTSNNKPKPAKSQTIKLPHDVAEKLVANNQPQPKTIISTQHPVSMQTATKVAPPIAATVAPETHSPSLSQNNSGLSSTKRIDDLVDKLNCRKVITRSLLINSKAEMHISGHEIATTNMFVPDHVVYHLTTVPLNIEVKRRFKDFETLRNILRKMFPLNKLPHLEKNSRLSETEPQVIKKQKYFLECFINDLLIGTEYQNCRIIEEFLTLRDLDHLKKKFKEYDKMQKVKAIEGLTSLNGEIQIRFSEKHLEYNDKTQNFIQVSEAYYQKIRQLYDQLVFNIQSCVKTLTELSEVFSSLENVTKTFNSSVQVNKFTELEQCYKYISGLNAQWANSLKTQSKLIESDIKARFKFEKENMGTIREITKIRSSITEAFLKRADKERVTSDKYTSSKLDDYKVSVDYPSKHIVVLTYQNAFVNEKTSAETERMFMELSLKLRTEFARFSKLQSNIYGDMKDIWARFSH